MPKQALKAAIESMNVKATEHPTGVIVVSSGEEVFTVFPHARRWTYRVGVAGEAPYMSGFYSHEDVDLLAHKMLTWSWRNGAKE